MLFDENIPLVKTQEEFQSLQHKFPNLDLYYLASACKKDRRERFECMYEVFQNADLSDKKFLRDIKSGSKGMFHQLSWEMFVAYTLIENGYRVERFRKDGKGVDFLVLNKSNKPLFYVECTACNPKNNESISFPSNSYIAQRISNSVSSKIDQYNKSSEYMGFINDLPYIIAINVGTPDINTIDLDIHLVEEIDPYVVLESLYGAKIKDGKSTIYRREKNKYLFVPIKQEPENFPTGYFLSGQNLQVSGVWFSTESVLNQNLEILGDKSLLVFNSFAKNSIGDDEVQFMTRLRFDSDCMPKELKFDERDIYASFENLRVS
ncbi:MAG: hypothetical protein ACRCZE_03015 [Candidatus Altimarinota bacterium]